MLKYTQWMNTGAMFEQNVLSVASEITVLTNTIFE